MSEKLKSRLELYREYIYSDHWKAFRLTKLNEHGRFCDSCDYKNNLHVHHINYRNYYDCTTADLAVLCEPCHDDFHLAAKCLHFNFEGVQVPEIKQRIAEFRATPHKSRIESKRARRKAKREARAIVKPHNRQKAIKKAYIRMMGTCSDSAILEMINFLSSVIKAPPVIEIAPPKKLRAIVLPEPVSEAEIESIKARQLRHKRTCAFCGSKDDLRAFCLRPNTMRICQTDFRTICALCAINAESREVTDYLCKFPNNTSGSLYAHLQIIFKRVSGIPAWGAIQRVA